ncbi:uncharacterized protein [Clytia hemisphaerica]|uniref:Uncharacterized protein n=1 Tax=Clytia hemisphaerica TaxID=252671 RepID=A0A7M6DMF3_9CNID
MHWIKLFLIPWVFLLILNAIPQSSSSCTQQKRNAFKFNLLGHSRSKNKCYQRCCLREGCHLPIFSPTTHQCYGVTCAHKQLCHFIGNQLKGFAGHRVDKRSLDSQIESNESREEDIDVEDNEIDHGDFGEDILKERSVYEEDKRRDIIDDTPSEQEPDEISNQALDERRSCPNAKFHQTLIPSRRRGFKFHKFHGHSQSLGDCSRRCCDKENCVLSFQLISSCFGILCNDDSRSCHTKKDHLPGLSLLFTHMKDAILMEPISHHRRKFERPAVERQSFLEDNDERDFSHHNNEEQELLNGLETTSPEKDFVPIQYAHKRHHHHHHHPSNNVFSEEDNTAFQHQSHHHKHAEPLRDDNSFGEDDEPTMVLPDRNKHHDYSGMDMHDDLQMLSKSQEHDSEQESIGATLSQEKHNNEVISGDGSGESETNQYHANSTTKRMTKKHKKSKKNSKTLTKSGSKSPKEIEMSKKIKTLEAQLKKNGAIVNSTNFHGSNELGSGSSDFESSGSGSIQDDEKHVKHYQPLNIKKKKIPMANSESQDSKRSRITKPKSKTEGKEHYGHKEDIFKEFEKSKHKSHHKEAVLKEVNRLKELENEIKQQEAVVRKEDDEDDSSGDSEGSGNLMKILPTTTTTTTLKPKHKKKKKKLKPLTTTTTILPTTTPTPTTTTSTTTTTKEPRKVVDVLKYQHHTPRPTKPISRRRNHTVHNTPTPHHGAITTSTPALTTTTTTRRPHTTKRKTTTTTTTTSTTTTSTTTITTHTTTPYVIPTVQVDDIDNSNTQKPNDRTTHKTSMKHSQQYDEEQTLQDLSKPKTMKHLKPKIPSLNIDVGDDDVDSDNQSTSSKINKDVTPKHSKNTEKQYQSSTAMKNTLKQKQNKEELLSKGKLFTTRKTTTTTLHTTKIPTTTTTSTTPKTTLQIPKQKDFYDKPYDRYGYPPYQEDDRASSYAYPEDQQPEYPSRYGGYPPPPMFSRYHDGYNEYREQPPYPPWRSPEEGADDRTLQRDQPGLTGGNPLDPSFNPYNLGFDASKGASLHPGANNPQGRISPPNQQISAAQNQGKLPQNSMNDHVRAPIHNFGDSPPEPYIIQQSHGQDGQENLQSPPKHPEEHPKEVQNDSPHHQENQHHPEPEKQNMATNQTPHHVDIGATTPEIHKENKTIHKEEQLHQKPLKITEENEHVNNNKTKTRTQISLKTNSQPLNKTQNILHKESPNIKESPQETISRILGDVNHILNQTKNDKTDTVENVDKNHKPLDTIHNILGSSLDKFFKDSEEKYNHKHMKNETGESTFGNHRKDRLDEFFKKAEITTHDEKHAKNMSTIQGVKKNHVETNPIKHKNETNNQNKGMVSPTLRHTKNESLGHFKDCAIRKDLPNYTFQNLDHVGYKYKMTRPMSVNDCLTNCCHHDTCHVAFHQDESCYLLQCSDPTLCDAVTRTKKKSRVLYLNKPVSTRNIKPKFCLKQNSGGIVWQQTPAKLNTTQPCPRKASGEAKRMCDEYSKWLPPDFSGCVSKEYAQIKEKTKRLGYSLSATDLIDELEQVTSETIDNSLIFGGNIKMATESLLQISNFLMNNQKENFNNKGLKGATKIISNLLDDANINEWNNIKENQCHNKVMQSLDKLGIYATKKLPDDNKVHTIVTRSILSSIGKITLDNKQPPKTKQKQAKQIVSPKQYIFPDYAHVNGDWNRKKDVITLPKNLFHKDRLTMVSSVVYKSLSQLLPHRWKSQKFVTFTDGFVVNSNILSCVVDPKPLKVLTSPVIITLHHLKAQHLDRSKCVWWDFNNSGGSWSTEGCEVITSNRTVTVCQCNHLTHFAILSSTKEEKISAKEEIKEHTMAIMWLGIPLMIVLTLGVLYTCFSWSKSPKKSQSS